MGKGSRIQGFWDPGSGTPASPNSGAVRQGSSRATHPSADLLRRCLSGPAGPALSVQVGRCSPDDWNEVTDRAIHNGLGPLLFARLKRSGARARIPADAWKRLRLVYLASASRNTRLFRGLHTVLGNLHSVGVPVVVLKGALLAEAVYGDTAVRPMCDVDLMVPRAEMPKAWTVLLDLGGVCMERTQRAAPAPETLSRDVESWCRREPHLPGVAIRRLIIELHWTLVPSAGPVRVDAAGLWHRARPATIAGAEVLALSPEDLLLHLCLHVCSKHRLDAGLLSFCDIAETVRRYRDRLDWNRVVHTTREWGAARHAALTFDLVGRMLGTSVPDDVLDRLVPGGLDPRISEMAIESVAARLASPGYVSRSVRDLWGARSAGEKARLVWERVFLSREEMADVYPGSRDAKYLCFYYVRRFRDVFAMHGASVPRVMLSRDIRQRASMMAAVTSWLESGKQ